MANRVNVNINIRDNARAALTAFRREMGRVQQAVRRASGTVRVGVRASDPRPMLRRLRQQIDRTRLAINTRVLGPPGVTTLRRRLVRTLGRTITVPVRVSGRGLVGTIRGPVRAMGGLVSGTLQDGVGQGILQGFQRGGPAGIAVLAAALVAGAAVIGGALSGLLVTALGAAFVGIGIVSAAKSQEINDQWAKTLEVLKEQFRAVGEPLIPVLDRALERLERMAKVAGPQLRKAIEDTAPATEKFINSLMDGFASFGKAAFKPIMDAWNVFAPVFGEEWNEFMGELGNSFGRMADLVRQHPTEIAAALDVVFETIDLLVDTITFLGKTWVFIMQNIMDAHGAVLKSLALLLDGALGAFEGILAGGEAVADFFGLDLGNNLSEAKSKFSDFRENAVSNLTDMANKAFGWDDALNKANRKRQLDADIETWKSKLERARADLKKTTDQKARKKIEADISDLVNKLRRARQEVAALKGKTVTITTRRVNITENTIINQQLRGSAAVGGGRAHGGVVGSAQTGGVRSNLTLVGEAGPEIVNLAPGSRVRSNPDTRRALQGGAGGRTVLEIRSGGSRMDDLLIEILRRAIHHKGGDVQLVLGRN